MPTGLVLERVWPEKILQFINIIIHYYHVFMSLKKKEKKKKKSRNTLLAKLTNSYNRWILSDLGCNQSNCIHLIEKKKRWKVRSTN